VYVVVGGGVYVVVGPAGVVSGVEEMVLDGGEAEGLGCGEV
jgi:hypothetical protein